MGMPLLVQEPVQRHKLLCHQQFNQMLLWLEFVAAGVLLAIYVDSEVIALAEIPVGLLLATSALAIPLLGVAGLKSWKFYQSKRQLNAYQLTRQQFEQSREESSAGCIQKVMSEAGLAASSNHLIAKLLEHYRPILNARLVALHKDRLHSSLNEEFASLKATCDARINEVARRVPLLKVKQEVETALSLLTRRRQEMNDQWVAAYEGFSWWDKIKHSDGPDFSEIDKAIRELTTLQKNMKVKHAADFKTLELHFGQLTERAIDRMALAKAKAEQFIEDGNYQETYDGLILKKALWLSAFSVPVSIWADVDRARDVYDALRGVNNNFAGMSDAEIWSETLLMPTESLAGLAALAKGAYFEQLVAADTGGQLYEHFNHPDTDIVIDGIAFQIKATESLAYVASVDDSIPVIATSEVAVATGAIDGGYSNEALTDTIDSALGGTVIDVGDTASTAILMGLGGLGFFATVEGINHAGKRYENGGDAGLAVLEGAAVAIEGAARAIVNFAELVYNILTSRPMRFVGRVLLWIGSKLVYMLDAKSQTVDAQGPPEKRPK
ncbi:MAG: hypothetical protein WDZ52_15065 [Pseudohongiellaceae bacterium]